MTEPNQSDFIPPVRVAEFPPGTLLLQSPGGWAYYENTDGGIGRASYLTPSQQPVSAYCDVHHSDAGVAFIFFGGMMIPVGLIPVWEWDGTNLAAKHFRPVPTSEPVAEAPPPIETPPPVSVHHVVLSGDVRDVITDASRSLQRIATALEGILADLTKGNDADKGE